MNQKKMTRLALVVFLSFLAVGIYTIHNRPFGLVFVELGNGRSPAAIKKTYDVSQLEGIALSKKIQERVIGEAVIVQHSENIGIQLGQFVIEGNENRKILACSVYNKVQLKFMAQGEASAGGSPMMTVESDCRISEENILMIQPIWVPTKIILFSPTSTKHFSFEGSEPISIEFQDINEQWPRKWILQSLKMYNSENKEQQISISRQEILQVAPHSLVMEW
ncbi:MAG: hypothetical protein K1X29_04305 [Bdellovibrionales bacterium]|nr:hypothetical protein [Bdellovibrionales bacterium]